MNLDLLVTFLPAKDGSGQILYEYDFLSKRTSWTGNVEKIIGFTIKELEKLGWEGLQILIHPDDRAAFAKQNNDKVNPGQFEQVLLNLAINGRDAIPDGGNLQIETSNVELDSRYCSLHPEMVPGKYIMIVVSYTGYGMSNEVKNHLFEPFYSTKSPGNGTGLGLPMIFGAVKQAGGAIEVYSEPGIGTTFRIYLPQVSGSAEKIVKEKQIMELPKGDETILLVEDQENVRELVKGLLNTISLFCIAAL